MKNLSTGLRKTFLQVCSEGYSVLGLTPAVNSDNYNPWQYSSGYPPSYFAQGRYRFLKTLQFAQDLNPRNILEVAAGGGFNAACLWKPSRRVVINDLRLEEDEVQIWSTGKFLEMESGNLFDLKPESLGCFDLVIACEVIEHVAHGDQLINHLNNFLAPGGTLLLTTPNGSYFRSKLPTYSQITDFNVLEKEQFKPDSDGHLYLYSPQEIYDLMKSIGFSSISIDLSITPWLSGHMGLRFLPASELLSPMYYLLENLTKNLGMKIRSKFCTQMIILATMN